MAAAWWPWAAVVLLGFYHGINPGMGWLFAVGRGLQEQSRRAVLGSLLPIAAGHELSVVAVIVLVAATQAVVPPHVVRLVAALVLITAGLYTLARPRRHPRGMGLGILRRGWFNLDLLWSGVLLLSGVATLFTVDPAVLSQTPALLTGH